MKRDLINRRNCLAGAALIVATMLVVCASSINEAWAQNSTGNGSSNSNKSRSKKTPPIKAVPKKAKEFSAKTPTLAYKALYEAVKRKDSEAIKKVLSKGTLEMMDSYASMQKKTLNEVIENGLTETTFAPKLPATRNERVTGEVAILEVKNEKTGGWEALPFAREDGIWKLAIDTFFKGTMSPKGPTNPKHPGQLP